MKLVLLLILIGVALYFGRRLLFDSAFKAAQHHPDVKARMQLLDESYRAEQTVIEAADWFGRTGLSEADERELPKYLRREFGELLLEEGSLKASDLRYLGAFDEYEATVHYWQVPSSDGEPTYAYIEVRPGMTMMGWGNRRPPA